MAVKSDTYARAACRWVKAHPDRFRRVTQIVRAEADRGAIRVSRGDVYLLAMQQGLPISDCEELKRNNNLWSALTRFMVMLEPRLCQVLKFRPASCDECDLVQIWREEVDADATFKASSWQHAQKEWKGAS